MSLDERNRFKFRPAGPPACLGSPFRVTPMDPRYGPVGDRGELGLGRRMRTMVRSYARYLMYLT
jgi:hypothetical protein